MNRIKLFIVILTCVAATASAKTLKYFEIGINQSKFRNEVCKSKIGSSFGIGLDYYPIRSLGVFIGSEMLYQNKRLLVEDRTWPNDIDPEFANGVWTGDFNVNISYLEIPLQIGYSVRIKNKITSSFFIGYSLSIPIKDHTKTKNRKVRELEPDERGTFDFDYVLVDESSVPMSKNFHLGFRLTFTRFALLISYAKAMSFTENLAQKSIQGKIDSFRILFAYMF